MVPSCGWPFSLASPSHRDPAVAGRVGLALADQLADAQHCVLVHVEVGVHRVHRHDGREQGAAVLVPRPDQVAHRDDVSTGAPADRRHDLRVLQVQLARRYHRLVGRYVGEIDAPGCGGLVQVGSGRCPGAKQVHIPLVLRLVELQLRLILGDLRLRLVQQRLIGARVEFKKDLPLLDQRPFLEVDLVQVAPDVRPHLDGIDRGRPGGEVRVVGDVSF